VRKRLPLEMRKSTDLKKRGSLNIAQATLCNYFPMQKVETRSDPTIYADFSVLVYSWRLTGD